MQIEVYTVQDLFIFNDVLFDALPILDLPILEYINNKMFFHH